MTHLIRRDALSWVCLVLHLLIVLYSLTGWLVASPLWLGIWLLFIPLMALHWQFNAGACVLNNLESLIRFGVWRAPANQDEGACMRNWIYEWLGYNLSSMAVTRLSYCILVIIWPVGFFRWASMWGA